MELDKESVNSDQSEEIAADDVDADTISPKERESVREEVSKMSFEELLRLKAELGTKIYNRDILGVPVKNKQTTFRRVNKNRPREMSSKVKPPPPVVIKKSVAKKEREKLSIRDPRFDPLCGSFDKKSFDTNYGFVYDIKKEERKRLKEEYGTTEDPQRKAQIKRLIDRFDNQIREHDKQQKERVKLEEEKQEIKEKVQRGERPIYKKKSEKRLDALVDKYEQLKRDNKLQKSIERGWKKRTAKERKRMSQ